MDAFKEEILLKILKENGYSICFYDKIPDVSSMTKKWFNSNVSVSGKLLSFEKFMTLCIQAESEVNKNLYIKNRIKEYPSIIDQLDMLYWDMVNNTSNWKNLITEIKEKYPKS